MSDVNYGLSDRVRLVALDKFIHPAMKSGEATVTVAVRDLMDHLRQTGFPSGNWPQVCTAIQTGKFLRENGLEIERVDGPPKKLSPTVVVRYRISGRNRGAAESATAAADSHSGYPDEVIPPNETPEQRIKRLVGRIRGIMKDEIQAMGGVEGYMRWVRSDDRESE